MYKYVKDFRLNRKQLLVNCLGGKCAKCKYKKCIQALDFHHIDSKYKEFTIAQQIQSLDKCIKEIKKCVLLCCRCHRELHSKLWYLSDINIPKFNTEVLTQYQNRFILDRKCETCGTTFVINKCNTKRFCSDKCRNRSYRKVKWPPKDQLAKEIFLYTWVELGKKYGVTDNAVKKWAKAYGLPTRTKDLKNNYVEDSVVVAQLTVNQ